MPITASLGALSFPKNLIVQAFTTNKGFSAVVPGYQFIPGNVSSLAAPLTGYTTAAYTTHGVDVDTDGNLYFSGVRPGTSGPGSTLPAFGIFKLDYTTGAPIYDTNTFVPEGAGISVAVNDADKTCFAGYNVSGTSQFNRNFQIDASDVNTGYYQSSVRTGSTGNDVFGIRTLGSNYYTCLGDESLGNPIGIVKTNSSNVYQNAFGIRDSQFFPLGVFFRDFYVDASENYYFLVNLTGNIPALVKFNPSTNTVTWSKQFNIPAWSIAVDSSGNIYALCSAQTPFSGAVNYLVKIDSSGNIVSQVDVGPNVTAIDGNFLRICIGSDGNLYVQGLGGNYFVTSWDTSLNLLWSNELRYIESNGVYTGPVGSAGIVEYNGSIYCGTTVGYDAQECIFVNRLPSDGSLVVPDKWWLGNGYGSYVQNTTTSTAGSSVTLTNYAFLIPGSPSISNSNVTSTDPTTQDGLVINKQL
jgi:hypothetical protein